MMARSDLEMWNDIFALVMEIIALCIVAYAGWRWLANRTS